MKEQQINQLNISHPLNIRSDLHLLKKEYLETLSLRSFEYVSGFIKLVYHNFITNQRKDIWDLDNFFNIQWGKEIREKIINPYYHHIHLSYNTFVHKAWYNQLNRECEKYYSQIAKNFKGYKGFIEKNLNNEIPYKDGNIVIYKPKRWGKIESLILDNEVILEKIEKQIEVFGLRTDPFSSPSIYDELIGKKASDTITLDIKKYNISPRKYYFHEWQEPIDCLSSDQLGSILFKKFRCPSISWITIPLDERFIGKSEFEKWNLVSLLSWNSQFVLDKSIWNQYFFKMRNMFSKENKSIKFPIEYNKYLMWIDWILKNKKHKKFQLDISKQWVSLEMFSKYNKEKLCFDKDWNPKKWWYEYSYNFKLNSTFEVKSKVNDKNLIRLLSYDLWSINTLSWSIIEINRKEYLKYLEKIKNTKFKKFVKTSENFQRFHDTINELKDEDWNINQEIINNLKTKYKVVKQVNFSGEKFNKKVEDIKKEIWELSKIKDYVKARILYKKIDGKRKSWLNYIVNQLLLNNIDVFIWEKLSIQGNKLKNNKDTNRMLSNITYWQLNKLLEYKQMLLWGHLSKVMSIFTSTFCSQCYTWNEENRVTQEEFKCLKCWHNHNADLHASEVIAIFFLLGLSLEYIYL